MEKAETEFRFSIKGLLKMPWYWGNTCIRFHAPKRKIFHTVFVARRELTEYSFFVNMWHLLAEESYCGGMGRMLGLACPPEDGWADLPWKLHLCRGTQNAEGADWFGLVAKKSVYVPWVGAGQEGLAWCEEVGLPCLGHLSVVFLNPVWCCPVGVQSGSKDTEVPGMTNGALEEKSRRDSKHHHDQWTRVHVACSL